MAPMPAMSLSQFPETALKTYSAYELSRLQRKLAMFSALPEDRQSLLPEYSKRIEKMERCIKDNNTLLVEIVGSASTITSSRPKPEKEPEISTESQMLLSHAIRKGFVLIARDWGKDEASEKYRSSLYLPLIDAINESFDEAKLARTSLKPSAFKVLVESSGTGRLAWELAKRGYSVEGCESSPVGMLFGNYALNATSVGTPKTVFPYVHETSNSPSISSMTHGITIPDVDPSSLSGGNFSIRAGSLITSYSEQHSVWDCICSCFSFDVSDASLLVGRQVMKLLKPGGVWAFVGPTPCVEETAGGILMSVEELMSSLGRLGLKVVKRERISCEWISEGGTTGRLKEVVANSWLVVCVKVRPAP